MINIKNVYRHDAAEQETVMERIIKAISDLKNGDSVWKERENLSGIEAEDAKEKIGLLISVTRELIKKQAQTELDEVKKTMENDRLYESLFLASRRTLKHYYAWKVVRDLETRDKERISMLFQNVMDKFVLRLEYDFQETNSLYGVEDQGVFYELLESCDMLVTYYIRRHYSRKEIVSDVVEETEVERESAEIFAELIEKNYNGLQMNVIIDMLARKGGKY